MTFSLRIQKGSIQETTRSLENLTQQTIQLSLTLATTLVCNTQQASVVQMLERAFQKIHHYQCYKYYQNLLIDLSNKECYPAFE